MRSELHADAAEGRRDRISGGCAGTDGGSVPHAPASYSMEVSMASFAWGGHETRWEE